MSTPTPAPAAPWLLDTDPGWAATCGALIGEIEARHQAAALATAAVEQGRAEGRRVLAEAPAAAARLLAEAAATRSARATHQARTAATALARPRARGALRPGMAAPAFRPAVIL